MNRFCNRAVILVLSALFTTGALLGCSSQDANSAKKKIKVMDFSKNIELKQAKEPVSKDPNILFLGNSFLFVNDLPSVFAALSESGGFKANVQEFSEGGYHLSYFADPLDELGALSQEALKGQKWDYVVLQEQSRIPTDAVMVEEETIPAVKKLDEMIKEAGGQTAFLMTWAYKNGDDLNQYGIDSVTTREEMQTQIAESYIKMAKEVDGLLSPAGIAFIRCAKDNPDIELWDEEDDMHPTLEGTYLAACTLYATLYHKSPVGLSYTAEIDADTAKILQQTAADAVLQ